MDAIKERLKLLFKRYLDKVESPEERFELHDLLQQHTKDEVVDLLLTLLPNEKYLEDPVDKVDWQSGASTILEGHRKESAIVPVSRKPFYSISSIKYVAAAVILLAILTPVIINYFKKPTPIIAAQKKSPLIKERNREATGGLPATSSPCTLVVPTQEQMNADSSIIHIDINNNIRTISVAPGWQFPTQLPDGSQVTLNSASTITCPRTFEENKREVEITGEAYFDIAQKINQPFYVKVKGAQLQVLGTSFNVNAYADNQSFSTTLVEGSLRAIKGKKTALLRPGQKAIIGLPSPQTGNEENIQISTGDTAQAHLWRLGYFSFRQTSIQEVLHELSSWYKWKVEYKIKDMNVPFTATFCRRTSEEEVLDLLRMKGIKFTKTGNKIIITQ